MRSATARRVDSAQRDFAKKPFSAWQTKGKVALDDMGRYLPSAPAGT